MAAALWPARAHRARSVATRLLHSTLLNHLQPWGEEGSFRLYTPIFNFGYSRAGPITEDKEKGATENMFGNSGGEEQEIQVRDTSLFEKALIAVGLMQPEKRLVQEFGQFVTPRQPKSLSTSPVGMVKRYIKILATLDPLLATVPSMPGGRSHLVIVSRRPILWAVRASLVAWPH